MHDTTHYNLKKEGEIMILITRKKIKVHDVLNYVIHIDSNNNDLAYFKLSDSSIVNKSM